jgi:hypothetical protein
MVLKKYDDVLSTDCSWWGRSDLARGKLKVHGTPAQVDAIWLEAE